MRIISFAWTTRALLEGRKTVTRRNWKECRLKPGELAQAYDRSPRFKGKRVAIIRISDIRRDYLKSIGDPGELEKEGGLWETPEDYIRDWQEAYPGSHKWSLVWRIGFEVVPKHCEGL